MIGFVLSGGGNRGALEVGALQVLLERGVKPDLVIGVSAGAVNGAFLASNPTVEGTRQLAGLWEHATQDHVYPGSRWQVIWRLNRRVESLYPNTRFHDFVRANLRAAHLAQFGDIRTGVRLYVVATRLETGTLHVFGDDPADSVADALMASTALPPLHPPWRYRDAQYIDGAFAAHLPIRLAIERGAREIYALHVTQVVAPTLPPQDMFDITMRAIDVCRQRETEAELDTALRKKAVVHYVPLIACAALPFWDFGHASLLVREGRKTMELFLAKRSREVSRNRRWWFDSLSARWNQGQKAVRAAAFDSREKEFAS